MRFGLRPLFRPVPLLTVSAGGAFLAARAVPFSTKTSSHSMADAASPGRGSGSGGGGAGPAGNVVGPWPVKAYRPRHPTWPYRPADFAREDAGADAAFYASPRFVTHIDDAAVASLTRYYDAVLPRRGALLDLCSSWVSHLPPEVERVAERGELRVVGLGLNGAELAANSVLGPRDNGGSGGNRVVWDLNERPNVGEALRGASAVGENHEGEGTLAFDASTMVVSIDYLTQPVEVLRSLREVTREGGTVHLTVSNRCFPTKAVARWLKVSEEERLLMVGDFLHFAGWEKIEIVELSNGKVQGGAGEAPTSQQGGLPGLLAFFGMNSRNPLWVVRATKGNPG